MVPRIAQVKVHRREDFGLLGQRDRLPLLFHRVGDRFLGYDVLPARNGFLNLLRAGIRQGEQPDRLNLGVVEYDLFVTDVNDIPLTAFLHLFEVKTSHSAKTDQTDFNWIHFV